MLEAQFKTKFNKCKKSSSGTKMMAQITKTIAIPICVVKICLI